jgi:undecaprenyl-diphosphatase
MSWVAQFDDGIVAWFEEHRSRQLARLMVNITALGSAPVLVLFIFLGVGLFLCFRRYGNAALLVVAAAGAAGLTALVKFYVDRARPPHPYPLALPEMSHSFPSGHSTASAATYLTLALIVAEVVPIRRVRVYLITTAFVLTFLIGISRVYLALHYPSDVMAGWGLGLAWALICHRIQTEWVLRRERRFAVDE